MGPREGRGGPVEHADREGMNGPSDESGQASALCPSPSGSVAAPAGILAPAKVGVVREACMDSSSQSCFRRETASIRDISQCESNEERPKAAR
ncbi:hypothetical protein Airi02_098490 [Actinoallomurus iriomotensis]|uniref:Uncharacterized protein n=1 Tax=Actinoallomurus iriomotensis TaxID=478107 RepID=A0A9W6SE45_9ACTN|nr:hypothetical protein Airi02_098490 [Actinoallomurus iriomotensis]